MTKVYIVDVESTGLKSYPRDIALSVGISEVDTEKKIVEIIYDKVIGYSTADWPNKWLKAWIFDNSILMLEDIELAYDDGQTAEVVGKQVHAIIDKEQVAIYNVGFDYGNYLRYEPFNMSRRNTTILPCLMNYSTPICKISLDWGSGWKWPTLTEAVDIILDQKIQKMLLKDQAYHSAGFDVLAEGHLLLELIKNHDYKV